MSHNPYAKSTNTALWILVTVFVILPIVCCCVLPVFTNVGWFALLGMSG